MGASAGFRGGASASMGASAGFSAGASMGASASLGASASMGASASIGATASFGGASIGISASAGFSFKSTDEKSIEEEESIAQVKLDKPKAKLGEKELPAENCLELKRYFPKILSGYYYIKPECSPKPLRVFCDFSLYKDVVDFYIFKDDMNVANPDLSYLKISNVEDVKYFCSRKGLYPIKLEHQDMIERIFHLLILDGYDLSGSNFIPLGFDYTCKNGKCSGIYSSLTARTTLPINQFFIGALEQSANPGFYVGFGLKAEPRMINFDIKQVKISGLICSTNKFETKSDTEVVRTISCEMNSSQNTEIFNKNDVIVRCPKGCEQSNVQVFGRGLYHGDSSICKAAIHAGILNGKGGKIKVVMQSPIDQYSGSHEHGILSSNKNNDGIRPFIIMKYVPKCPIDRFKEKEAKNKFVATPFKSNLGSSSKKASFLETGYSSEINYSAEKLIKELTENLNDYNNYSNYNNNSNIQPNTSSEQSKLEIEAFKQRFTEKESSQKTENESKSSEKAQKTEETKMSQNAFSVGAGAMGNALGYAGGDFGFGGSGLGSSGLGYGLGFDGSGRYGGYGQYGGGVALGLNGQFGGYDINNYSLGTGYGGSTLGYSNWDGYSKGMGLAGIGLGQSQVQGLEGSGMASVRGMGNLIINV